MRRGSRRWGVLSLLLAGMLAMTSLGEGLQALAAESEVNAVQEEIAPETVSGNEEAAGQNSHEAVLEQERDLDYILGRPLTPEERQEQDELFDYYMGLGAGVIEPEELPEDGVLPGELMQVMGNLPTQYDARNVNGRNLVPDIRNQGQFGTCWCYSSIACLEINLIKNGLADMDIDLSEHHLAFFANYSAPDPLGNDGQARSYYDANQANGVTYYDRGGNYVMAAGAFMNWKGAVEEGLISDSMVTSFQIDPDDTALAYGNDIYYMSNWHQIPTYEPAAVKTAIMEYGAVGLSFYSYKDYYNPDTAASYCPEEKGTNHAVTVVGWDDTYSRENFNTMPSHDGAWLIRNSWGGAWGDEGYFWLSYEDRSIYGIMYAFEGQRSDQYDNNYQYDHATLNGYMSISKAANVFTAKANGNKMEELSAVGIDLSSAGVRYRFQIYTNMEDPSDPTSGVPMLSTPQEGMTGYAGYYTIPLKENVLIEPEDTFSIVFEAQGNSGEYVNVACEYDSDTYRHSEPEANPGESFFTRGASGWYDFGERYDKNLKIKAYTRNTEIVSVPCRGISLSCPDEVIDVGATAICEVSFDPVDTTNKMLRWSSSDPAVVAVSEDGRITGLKKGTATVTAVTVKGGYTASWEVTVIQPVTQVHIRYNTDEYYVGDSYQAIVEIGPEDANDKSLEWVSSNTKVALVDGAGNITVKAAGSARITATAQSGVSDTVNVQAREDKVRAFVKRMYTKALDREAEPTGLRDWTNRLKSQEVDGAGIAHGFICSQEFIGRNLSDNDYVDILYSTFFDRQADREGKTTWMRALASGESREHVLSGFVNSREFSGLCDRYNIARGTMQEDGSSIYRPGVRQFVTRLYLKALNRQGETMGVEDWTNEINMGKKTPEDVAKAFFDSDEFLNRRLSDADYVETLYQTFMDRASDPAGKQDWLESLRRGMTRKEVLEGFSRSEEFGKIMKEYGL